MLDILEQYLKDEGLYSVILEHRRRSLFRTASCCHMVYLYLGS